MTYSSLFLDPIFHPSRVARTFNINSSARPPSKTVVSAFGYGLVAGLVGMTAMGITQTVELRITGRSPSYVPGETILRVLLRNFGHVLPRSRSSVSSGKAKQEESDEMSPSNLTDNPPESPPPPSQEAITAMRWSVRFGQGMVVGGVRGILSYYGARGLATDLLVTSGSLCPVWTEVPLMVLLYDQLPDMLHQMVYAFITGFFCDHWVR